MMEQHVIAKTGFHPCEYAPSPDDECEKCNTANVQLYAARSDYWEQEYDTWCESCVYGWYLEILKEEAPAEAGTP